MAVTVTGTGITFNDSTTQTTAYVAGGGVTSLNGQTGAVVDTSVNSIGSLILALNTTTSNYYSGQTIAGSSLRYVSAISSGSGALLFTEGSNGSNPNTRVSYNNIANRNTSGNTGYTNPGGTTALSGTYRCMSICAGTQVGFDAMCNVTTSSTYFGLWVRVS
jgi:hypothetical protein